MNESPNKETSFQIGFWHPFGPHGGETAEEILERKHGEIEKNGWTLWSFQKRLTLESWHEQICAVSAKSVFVFCSEGKGARDPKGEVQYCKRYRPVGDENWKPLPQNIEVPHPIGRKIEASAFVVKQIHYPDKVCEQLAVEYFSDKGEPHWRVDKVPTRGEYLIRPGGTILMRRYCAVLELREPYLAVVSTDDSAIQATSDLSRAAVIIP